jgi:hypothetical protein
MQQCHDEKIGSSARNWSPISLKQGSNFNRRTDVANVAAKKKSLGIAPRGMPHRNHDEQLISQTEYLGMPKRISNVGKCEPCTAPTGGPIDLVAPMMGPLN